MRVKKKRRKKKGQKESEEKVVKESEEWRNKTPDADDSETIKILSTGAGGMHKTTYRAGSHTGACVSASVGVPNDYVPSPTAQPDGRKREKGHLLAAKDFSTRSLPQLPSQ